MINTETGNCVNETVVSEEKICPEGKYLNILTGRCKKIESETAASVTPCPDGYERNPETNRCRKIRTNDASEYPVEKVEEGSYDSPQIFIAVWALIVLGAGAAAYVIFQFRHEIGRWLKRRFKKHDKL